MRCAADLSIVKRRQSATNEVMDGYHRTRMIFQNSSLVQSKINNRVFSALGNFVLRLRALSTTAIKARIQFHPMEAPRNETDLPRQSRITIDDTLKDEWTRIIIPIEARFQGYQKYI